MLPKSLQPYAKAIAPFTLTLVAIAIQWAVTGEYDRAELTTTLTGLSAALLTYLVPNRSVTVDLEGEPAEGDETTLGTPVRDLFPDKPQH